MTKKTDDALVDLTRDENKRLLNPRDGYEVHVAGLVAIYEKYKAELLIPNLDPQALVAQLPVIEQLDKDVREAEKRLEMLKETRRLKRSEHWSRVLAIYDRAQSAKRNNKEIGRAIADFEEFMKNGPRKKKGEPAK
jgi:hypothetical protein